MESEAVRGIKTVKSFANEWLEVKLCYEKLKELYQVTKKGFIAEPVLQVIDQVNLIF